MVDLLVEDYEQTGDVVIRLLSLEQRQPAVRAVIDCGRAEHRRWVSRAFAEVLDRLDTAARLSLMPDAPVESIRAACARLLIEPSLRGAAQRLGDLVAAEAEGSTIAQELEAAADSSRET